MEEKPFVITGDSHGLLDYLYTELRRRYIDGLIGDDVHYDTDLDLFELFALFDIMNKKVEITIK